ncbi:hypothetical protein C7S17_5854 [Burkholderia thailandensis]|nr:hypothetical protein [Burkholderia thailandensis]
MRAFACAELRCLAARASARPSSNRDLRIPVGRTPDVSAKPGLPIAAAGAQRYRIERDAAVAPRTFRKAVKSLCNWQLGSYWYSAACSADS